MALVCMARLRSLHAMVVALVLLAMVPSAQAGGGGSEVESGVAALVLVATMLVMLSIGMERGKKHLMRCTPKHMHPIVESLLMELANMGFISILLYLLESSSILGTVSDNIWQDSQHLHHIFHEVHIMLFFVMITFLSIVTFMVVLAFRLGTIWHHFEAMAQDNEGAFRSKKRNCCLQLLHICTCFAFATPTKTTYEAMEYALLRRHFIDGDKKSHTLAGMEKLDLEAGKDGKPIKVVLNPNNSEAYRKKHTVLAFSVDAPVNIEKHWGKSAGNRGDMVVNSQGDVYVCKKEIFEKTYDKVDGCEYRKKTKVFAVLLEHSFIAINTHQDGTVTKSKGAPGSYLVQNEELVVSDLSARGDKGPLKKQKSLKKQTTRNGTVSPESPTASSREEVEDFSLEQDLGVVQWVVSVEEFKSNYESVGASSEADNSMRQDFDFSKYLALCMGHTLSEVVEVSMWSWVVIEALLLICWAIYEMLGEMELFVIVLACMGSFFIILAALLLMCKLRSIRRWLTPGGLAGAIRTDQASTSIKKNAVHAVCKGEQMDAMTTEPLAITQDNCLTSLPVLLKRIPHYDPPYMARKLQPRGSKLARWIMGRPPNRHEQLLWFDVHGHWFAMFCIEALVLVLSLYISICLQHFWFNCDGPVMCVVRGLPVIIPLLVVAFVLPYALKDLIIVTSIEQMRMHNLVSKVLRTQQMQRSIRALRLLAAMKMCYRQGQEEKKNNGFKKMGTRRGSQFLRRGSSKHIGPEGAAERVWGRGTTQYTQRRRELQNAFDMFDRDGNDCVTTEDMRDLLKMIGIDNGDIAVSVTAEMDFDGTGKIEFYEFLDWVANKEGNREENTVELTKMMFQAIDADGSGTITATELRSALSALGGVMSHDDVVAIVADADGDGDGEIDEAEFAELIKKNLAHMA